MDAARPVPELTPSVLRVVAAAWGGAAAALGEIAIAPEAVARGLVERIRHRRTRRGLAADDAVLEALAGRASVADFALVLAADRGDDRAWGRLHATYPGRLQGLVRAREGAGPDAVAIVGDVWAELALPPEDGPARTRLGSYDGSAPLWGWLSAVLVHRLLRRGRDRLRPVGDPVGVADARGPTAPEPAAAVDDAETVAALDAAFRVGWTRLEPHERCVIVWKHRHGLAQRRIAHLLGVREDRVSRWVDRAIAKLRAAVAPVGRDGDGPWAEARRDALLARLATLLARVDAEAPPPGAAAGARSA